jgi:hypothetical protein
MLGLSQVGMNPEPKTLDHVFIPFHFNAFSIFETVYFFYLDLSFTFFGQKLSSGLREGGIRILLMCLVLILPLLPAFVQESGAMLTPNINLC